MNLVKCKHKRITLNNKKNSLRHNSFGLKIKSLKQKEKFLKKKIRLFKEMWIQMKPIKIFKNYTTKLKKCEKIIQIKI